MIFLKKLVYGLYLMFFRNTPEDWRPYALFFPWARRVMVTFYLDQCGKRLRVKSGAEISPKCRIGSNSELGTRCLIQSGVEIGSNVIMGPDVKIYSRNHKFDNVNLPIGEQGKETKSTIVGDDVWIGANVVILPGVKVNNHSIIGAGSIVTKDIGEYEIVGGNPASVIKNRKN